MRFVVQNILNGFFQFRCEELEVISFPFQFFSMIGWSAVQLDVSGSTLIVSPLNEEVVNFNRMVQLNTSEFLGPRIEGVAYLAVPDLYLGNRITSYGGLFTYSLLYLVDGPASEFIFPICF